MMHDLATQERVLLLTPTGDDAQRAREVLANEHILAHAVDDIATLLQEMRLGAGALLIAQEGFGTASLRPLIDEIAQQPSWSDLPILIVMSRADADESGRIFLNIFSGVGSLCFLERPFRPFTLITAVRSALRARRRQYEVRDLLLKQSELYNQAAQAIRIRDEFISIASHELKTPITSLKLRFEIAARDFKPEENKLPAPAKLERLFTVGAYQVARLNSLIDDLLDISRIQNGKMSMNLERADLTKIIEDSLGRLQEHLGASESSLEADMPQPVWGLWDAARLEQVLVNLVSNAMKYAPKSKIAIRLLAAQGRVQLCVEDNGPGIPQEQQARLFHQFERASASRNIAGLGLGLYIVRQIVQAHGGSVSVESASGYGSKFIVHLPLCDASSPRAE